MEPLASIVQIYAVPDAYTQQFVGELLRARDLIVTTIQSGSGLHLLLVDSDDDDRARWVHEFVMSIGVDAVLLHASNESTAAYESHAPHEFAKT
jgi:hypothetical protein